MKGRLSYHGRSAILAASLSSLFYFGATSCAPERPAENALPPAPAPSASVAAPRSLPFIEDDLDEAVARAKAEGKALFVDAWAPWCHTCLSMKNYVFTDPSLAPLEGRVVFASIDTDRPSSAKFLETHTVPVWPMFFVIDPTTDQVAGAWPGSASLAELRSFIDDSLATIDALRAGKLEPEDPVRLIAEARAAHAAGDFVKSAALFARAAGMLPKSHPRFSEVLAGRLLALYSAKDWPVCAAFGEMHLLDVRGAAIPADFASFLLSCAEHLPPPEDARVRNVVIERLIDLTAKPPADASADDRADAWSTLGDALKDAGDEGGAKRAYEAKLAILEKAAAQAPSSQIAATFDYGRAAAYVALGRGAEAVALLEKREREMPDSYEPPARLASALFKMERYPEAKAAIDRAIARAYGPRMLGYLRLRASIQTKQGDAAGALATLRDELAATEALPAGQSSPARLEDVQKRIAAAQAAAAPHSNAQTMPSQQPSSNR